MSAESPNSTATRKPRRWVAAILLAVVLGGLAHFLVPWLSAEPETVIVVIRHAERSSAPGKDPPLSPAGEARAQALVQVARTAGFQKIYTSEFQRTQQTAQPLATALGLTIDPTFQGKDLSGLSNDILKNHRGQTVLVVHHTNTVPQLIALLGGGVVPPIDDAREFDRFYIIHHRRSGTSLTLLKYGAVCLP